MRRLLRDIGDSVSDIRVMSKPVELRRDRRGYLSHSSIAPMFGVHGTARESERPPPIIRRQVALFIGNNNICIGLCL